MIEDDAGRSQPIPAVIGAALTAPLFLFVTANLVHYGLGLRPPLDLTIWIDALLADPARKRIFELLSPGLFLGLPLVALALNTAAVARLRIDSARRALTAILTVRGRWANLAVAAASAGLLALLAGYLVAENLPCWLGFASHC